jgi:predicted DNA-binding protein (UPF0251 family)
VRTFTVCVVPNRSPRELEPLRAEALRLRTEERLNNSRISEKLGICRATVAAWLKGHPLADILFAEAFRLRTEERLSYSRIAQELGIHRKTVAAWLSDYPASAPSSSQVEGTRRVGRTIVRGNPSRWWPVVEDRDPDNADRGRIAESAVAFRLCVHGFEIYSSSYDGSRADFVVRHPSAGALWKIQVKSVWTPGQGMPQIPVRRSSGAAKTKVPYTHGELDFLVGYDLLTDVAYVYSWRDIAAHANQVKVSPEHEEAWWKLTGDKPPNNR